MRGGRKGGRHAAGFSLLECLFSLLIFSVGILALVQLQARAMSQSREARYRVDASTLASQMLGEMWVSDRSASALNARFGSAASGSGYAAWLTSVSSTLPGVTSYPPTVTVASGGALAGSTVTIQIYWKAPTEKAAAAAHRYTVTTQII
ncbi:MAG: prepilin-type N-terminal cleavage/methylation protein [Hydrocarboniphaga sp.]|uniref:type IV pilus modification protein PilV n=1 Tax=Hydrocarboniphaga sp. TaxID=2033016 RepID=UPI002627FB94|nr:type IV pilus modification protein PilV [Hydrocarboniphaga sp.]MDB5971607.1 prepilin-type N-terminal cleavage/methylation protein [Hydrocarboniphaga sp.]